jgi:hypothetical protein
MQMESFNFHLFLSLQTFFFFLEFLGSKTSKWDDNNRNGTSEETEKPFGPTFTDVTEEEETKGKNVKFNYLLLLEFFTCSDILHEFFHST